MMQWFWWLMFGFSFLIPLFMIIFGLVFWFHPPKKSIHTMDTEQQDR